eukprot:4680038-Alexandrium_andersonii.AAC.1
MEAKSNPEHPSYKYVASMAMETFRNEPIIFVEWGAKLRKLTQCVNEAYAGTAKGYDTSWNTATSTAPQQ